MARGKKSLAGVFGQYDDQKTEEENQKQTSTPSKEGENEKGEQNPENETSNVTELQTEESVQENETVNSNTTTVTKDVTQEHNTDSKIPSETESYNQLAEQLSEQEKPEPSTRTIRDVRNNIMSMYDEKSKKKTVEETHNRATFLFRKDLQTRLDKLSEGKRGFKTMFLNQAVEALLNEMEDQQ